jgi:hypothetical protein
MNPDIYVITSNMAALYVGINLQEIFGRFFILYLHKIKPKETVNNETFLIFRNDQRNSDIAYTWILTYVLVGVMFYVFTFIKL